MKEEQTPKTEEKKAEPVPAPEKETKETKEAKETKEVKKEDKTGYAPCARVQDSFVDWRG